MNETAYNLRARQPAPPLLRWLLAPWSLPLLLLLALGGLAASVAYQAPPTGRVEIGELGDRLFVPAHSGLGAEATERGALYPDELTPDSPTGRSRWSRQQATIVLPNLGRGVPLELTLLLQGWPTDVREAPLQGVVVQRSPGGESVQPTVVLRVDGIVIDTFVPTPAWTRYTFRIPPAVRNAADLTLTLETGATFTSTDRGEDPRPKGVRLAAVEVAAPAAEPLALLAPALRAVLLLTLAAVLLYALLLRLTHTTGASFLLAVLATGAAGAGLAMVRIWMGAVLTVAVWLLLLALLVAYHRPLLGYLRALLRRYARGDALTYGLLVAALVWLALTVANVLRALRTAQPHLDLLWAMFPDSLLFGLLSASLLALALVYGRAGLPQLAHTVVGFVASRRGALTLLLAVGVVWFGYEAVIIARLPYVGHADYADNAVVARNLVAGRGWVVDYVTQFYKLYDGLTRPQETWPLLQPVWIAPFVALFGDVAWAVKIPNLLFNIALFGLIYAIGARLWDRRVGLVAASITLTNHLFFNLTIYATSDLGFVLFTTAAIYLLYLSTEHPDGRVLRLPGGLPAIPLTLLGAAVCTGLLMLQKPSGALIAVGMGLWLLARHMWPARQAALVWWRRVWRAAVPFAVWALLALLVLSPYLLRNMAVFGAPVYSTERYDAWVLGYRGDSGDAWHDIYRVYAPELGGAGLPDHSWVLRWGFDYTYAKLETQFGALRDYLLPAWQGLPPPLAGPDGQAALFSRNESRNLMSPLGAWLALLGGLGALWARRRLFSLLCFAFTPYTLFLLTYWRTNEERYFLMLMPWLALLIAWIIWAGYDRLATVGNRRWRPLGLILVLVAVVSIMQHSWGFIATKVQVEPQQWAPDVAAYEWLAANTPPDSAMMTRNPWQLNWHAERAALMIPNTPDKALLSYIADYYGVDYLVLETLQRVKGDGAQTIAPLLNARTAQVGDVIDGFQLVYASPTPDNRVLIYQFPDRFPEQADEP